MNEPTNWQEWEIAEAANLQKIDGFVKGGHSKHCACRLVWGDGECECRKSLEQKATHKISFWGVRCYWNEETGDIWGVDKLNEHLITAAVWFHNAMSFIAGLLLPGWVQPGFRFGVLEDYTGKVKP